MNCAADVAYSWFVPVAEHYRLSPSERAIAVEALVDHPGKALACYRAIAASLDLAPAPRRIGS